MNEEVVRVADFAILPGARHRDDGDNSADEFYEDRIEPILKEILKQRDRRIKIDLDGTLGYASSFVSQLAVRIKATCNGKKNIVKKKILIKSDDDPGQSERFWNEIK